MNDVIVIGGGLAGLFAAHELAIRGHKVVLFERKNYPFHRVCGEYISKEVQPLLDSRGLYPSEFMPANINQLRVSSMRGTVMNAPLTMGGFGISRYSLDQFWAQKAIEKGVKVITGAEVVAVAYTEDGMQCTLQDESRWQAKVIIGAYGKRSKLDMTLKRPFTLSRSPYVGVKYHLQYDHPTHEIALHNFPGGYCGISRVEQDRVNLCYLASRAFVRKAGNIDSFEHTVLRKNPHLNQIWANATFLFDKPEVINEISFAPKQAVESHMLMAGDTAGLITPLCGNGMAMAIHGALLAAHHADLYLQKKIGRQEMESSYTKAWTSNFAFRLKAGRTLQKLFGERYSTELAIRLVRSIPPLRDQLIRLTHGSPIPI